MLTINQANHDRSLGVKFIQSKDFDYEVGYIPAQVYNLYCKCCPCCIESKPRSKSGVVAQPSLPTSPMERVQIDLMDYVTAPDVPAEGVPGVTYNYVCSIVDVSTGMPWFKPLPNKQNITVAKVLYDLFTTLNLVPQILHSDNGREFLSHTINDADGGLILNALNELWGVAGMRERHGCVRWSQSQGKVENLNKLWQKHYWAWVCLNPSRPQYFSVACPWIQTIIANIRYRTSKGTRVSGFYGFLPRVMLPTSSELSVELLDKLRALISADAGTSAAAVGMVASRYCGG